MATMNVSLPDPMKQWVEAQTDDGAYSNASDYVRDLIRRDQVRKQKIAHLQKLIDESYENDLSTRSKEEIVADAKSRIAAKAKAEAE